MWRSTAWAIDAAALPAPSTIVRPRGAGGRWGSTACAGWAAAIATSSSSRNSASLRIMRCGELMAAPSP